MSSKLINLRRTLKFPFAFSKITLQYAICWKENWLLLASWTSKIFVSNSVILNRNKKKIKNFRLISTEGVRYFDETLSVCFMFYALIYWKNSFLAKNQFKSTPTKIFARVITKYVIQRRTFSDNLKILDVSEKNELKWEKLNFSRIGHLQFLLLSVFVCHRK